MMSDDCNAQGVQRQERTEEANSLSGIKILDMALSLQGKQHDRPLPLLLRGVCQANGSLIDEFIHPCVYLAAL